MISNGLCRLWHEVSENTNIEANKNGLLILVRNCLLENVMGKKMNTSVQLFHIIFTQMYGLRLVNENGVGKTNRYSTRMTRHPLSKIKRPENTLKPPLYLC